MRKKRKLGSVSRKISDISVTDNDWPDWTNETIFIVSGGASSPKCLKYITHDMRIFAVNRAFELVPNADALYAADTTFWKYYPKALEFKGLKLTCGRLPGIREVRIFRHGGKRHSHMVRDKIGLVGYGGNSGFQALNLAVQFGAKTIYLAGYDFGGKHWHEDHKYRNPSDKSLSNWAKLLDGEAETLRNWGVRVINCSPNSRLKNYEHVHVQVQGVA